ncbi:MAG: SDR family oxidoreductase [Planctomycetota bacterium]
MSRQIVMAGGSHGIGQQIVQAQLALGNRVHVYSRESGALSQSDLLTYHSHDFTSDAALEALPDAIDGAVYCPGSINLKSFRSLKVDDFLEDLQVNLLGAVRFLQAVMPALRKTSAKNAPTSVVLFSTIAVAQGMSMHASVAAAKGAVEGLARSLAAEWSPSIRVNCIAPALTETPLSERFFKSDEARKALAERYPLGRTGEAEDVAAAASFLLSEDSAWMTGQVLGIDGGMSSIKK